MTFWFSASWQADRLKREGWRLPPELDPKGEGFSNSFSLERVLSLINSPYPSSASKYSCFTSYYKARIILTI